MKRAFRPPTWLNEEIDTDASLYGNSTRISVHAGRAVQTPDLSFLLTSSAGVACVLRLLRQPSRPSAPRPLANRGSAAGSGVSAATTLVNTKVKSS
jgi:hypothetical protein